jgi:MFS family permease
VTDHQTSTTARRIRGAQVAVAATFFAHGLLFASWAAHIPHVKAHLGVDNGSLGIALLGAPVGSVSAIAVAGYLVPRVGSRRVVQGALLGYCAAGPFVGVAGSVVGLFIALYFWGAFQGALDIAMNTQAITVEGARRRPLMNGMHASWSIGAFAGAGTGALGVAVGLSLSRQLLILGTLAFLVIGWFTTGLLPDAPHDAERAKASGERRISAAMLLLGAVAFASMLCEGAAADWSSVYLRDSVGGSTTSSGLGYAAFASAMVVVRLFGNRLLRRWSARCRSVSPRSSSWASAWVRSSPPPSAPPAGCPACIRASVSRRSPVSAGPASCAVRRSSASWRTCSRCRLHSRWCRS